MQSPQRVLVYLNDENGKVKEERVLVGPMRGYEAKLAKLRTFLENSAEATRDKHYYELDVRFKGQVIGRY